MELLADEGVDRQIVERLREDGHRVSYVAEMEPGIADEQVLKMANNESLVLLTADKDFGELTYRMQRVSAAIVLIRLSGLSPERKAHTVSSMLSEHGPELMPGTFTVLTPGAIRIRK